MLRTESGRGMLATPPGQEDGAMYSNSSDSNYTNHTPSLASIYQVTYSHTYSHTYSYYDIWDLNLSLGETESDKKLIVAGGNSISHLLSGEQYCGGGKVSLFWFYTKILFHRGYGYNSHARPLTITATVCWVSQIIHSWHWWHWWCECEATSVSSYHQMADSVTLCPLIFSFIVSVSATIPAAICWDWHCPSQWAWDGKSRACNHPTLTSFHL